MCSLLVHTTACCYAMPLAGSPPRSGPCLDVIIAHFDAMLAAALVLHPKHRLRQRAAVTQPDACHTLASDFGLGASSSKNLRRT